MVGSKVALCVELGDNPPPVLSGDVVGLVESRLLLLSVDFACNSGGGDWML